MRAIGLFSVMYFIAACGNVNETNATGNMLEQELAFTDKLFVWPKTAPKKFRISDVNDGLSESKRPEDRRRMHAESEELPVELIDASVEEETEEMPIEDAGTSEGFGGGGTSETPVFDCAGMEGCVCREDGCHEGLVCNAYGVCEPEACEMVECALRNNACNIFYCTPTSVYCQSHLRDDDYDGAASCGIWEEGRLYPGGYDCNDYNHGIHPGVVEVCGDGVDNDCNDEVDSHDAVCAPDEEICMGLERRLRDLDSDGYGDPDNYVVVCTNAPWVSGFVAWVDGHDDCDAGNPSIHPGAEEMCGNGQDENCDGSVDEECGGKLAIEKSAGSPKDGIVLGSTSRIIGVEYNIRPAIEGSTVDNLEVVNCIAWNPDGTCGIWGEDRAVSYVDEDGTAVSHSAYLSVGVARFSDLAVPVSMDGTAVVKVYFDTNAVGPTGASSGDQFSLSISTGGFSAFGMVSGEELNDFTPIGDLAAGVMTLRKSKPTVVLSAGSPYGADIPGFSETLRLNVCADSHGDVGIRHLLMDVQATDNADNGWNACGQLGVPTKWQVIELNDPSIDLLGSEFGGTCDTTTDTLMFVIVSMDLPLSIPASMCKSLAVFTDMSNASSTMDDSFRLTLTSVIWDDGEEATRIPGGDLRHLPVSGGALMF